MKATSFLLRGSYGRSDYSVRFPHYPGQTIELWFDGRRQDSGFNVLYTPTGATVRLDDPRFVGRKIFLRVRTPSKRQTLFRDGEVLSARDLNQEFDHIHQILRELLDREQSFLRLAPTHVGSFNPEVPRPRSKEVIIGNAQAQGWRTRYLPDAQTIRNLKNAYERIKEMNADFRDYLAELRKKNSGTVAWEMRIARYRIKKHFEEALKSSENTFEKNLRVMTSDLGKAETRIKRLDTKNTALENEQNRIFLQLRRVRWDLPRFGRRISAVEASVAQMKTVFTMIEKALGADRSSSLANRLRSQIRIALAQHTTLAGLWQEKQEELQGIQSFITAKERAMAAYQEPPPWATKAETSLAHKIGRLKSRVDIEMWELSRHYYSASILLDQTNRANRGIQMDRDRQQRASARLSEVYTLATGVRQEVLDAIAEFRDLRHVWPRSYQRFRDLEKSIKGDLAQASEKIQTVDSRIAQMEKLETRITAIQESSARNVESVDRSIAAAEAKIHQVRSQIRAGGGSSRTSALASQQQRGNVVLASSREVTDRIQAAPSAPTAAASRDKVLTVGMLTTILDSCRTKVYRSSWMGDWNTGQSITVTHDLGRIPDRVQILAKITKDIGTRLHSPSKGLRKGMVFDLSAAGASHSQPGRGNVEHHRFFSVEYSGNNRIILHPLREWPVVRGGNFFGLTGTASGRSQTQLEHNLRGGNPDVDALIQVNAWAFPSSS